MVVLKESNHRATSYQIVRNNSDRETILGCHAVEVCCCGFLSRNDASCADVISNVNASILNIVQDNDKNSTNTIELKVKRAIATREANNEETEFDYSTGWTKHFKIASPEDD